MEKPFTMKMENLKNEIIKNINDAKLPAFNVIYILNEIQNLVSSMDKKEIEEYNNEIKNIKKEDK